MTTVDHHTVLARNLRRLRNERQLTQDLVATRARLCGLADWRRETVAAVETRQRRLTFLEVHLLPTLLGRPLAELGRLEDGETAVAIEGAVIRPDVWRRLLIGQGRPPKSSNFRPLGAAAPVVVGVSATLSLLETAASPGGAGVIARSEPVLRAAERLGVEPERVVQAAVALWGRSLTDERDRRLRKDKRPGNENALRGRITRTLVDELRAELASEVGR